MPIKAAVIAAAALMLRGLGGQVMVWAGRRDKREDGGGLELMPLEMMRSVKVARKQELRL